MAKLNKLWYSRNMLPSPFRHPRHTTDYRRTFCHFQSESVAYA